MIWTHVPHVRPLRAPTLAITPAFVPIYTRDVMSIVMHIRTRRAVAWAGVHKSPRQSRDKHGSTLHGQGFEGNVLLTCAVYSLLTMHSKRVCLQLKLPPADDIETVLRDRTPEAIT
jgi:hypothetical protein